MGRHKALLPMPQSGEPLITVIIRRMRPLVTGRIIVVANDEPIRAFLRADALVHLCCDRTQDAGPLAGLSIGLSNCVGWAMTVACDMPFVDPGVWRLLVSYIEAQPEEDCAHIDAIVPIIQGRRQPLHALYHRRCIGQVDRLVGAKQYKMQELLDSIRVRYVDESSLQAVDPRFRSFTNVNTPEEWQMVEDILCSAEEETFEADMPNACFK